MANFSATRLGRRLVGAVLAVSVVGAIAQGALDEGHGVDPAMAQVASAAVDQWVSLADEVSATGQPQANGAD